MRFLKVYMYVCIKMSMKSVRQKASRAEGFGLAREHLPEPQYLGCSATGRQEAALLQ